ncbi:MAG TPA: tetratricopeptide repeat protein [Pyrinomonadaceae bacterium]|nr:tetratricopeptide repeat protein [Pyrinomonadaceae bacterium]
MPEIRVLNISRRVVENIPNAAAPNRQIRSPVAVVISRNALVRILFDTAPENIVGRNKIAVSAAAVVVLSLIGGLSIAVWQYRHAERERVKSNTVNDFLERMLSASNPGFKYAGKQGRDVTIAVVLDEFSKQIESGELATEPAVKADLQRIIGTSYLTIGKYDAANKNLRAALAAQKEFHGENSPETLKTLVALGSLALAKAARQSRLCRSRKNLPAAIGYSPARTRERAHRSDVSAVVAQ